MLISISCLISSNLKAQTPQPNGATASNATKEKPTPSVTEPKQANKSNKGDKEMTVEAPPPAHPPRHHGPKQKTIQNQKGGESSGG